VCYICLDGGDVLRGCACRGASAGFAHVDCLAEMAARDEWMTIERLGLLSRWQFCATCHVQFTGALQAEMARRRSRHYRDGTDTSVEARRSLGAVANFVRHGHELDVADRLGEEAVRGLDRDHPEVLVAEINKAASTSNPDAALEILTRLGPRMAECTVRDIRVIYADVMACVLAILGRLDEALCYAAEAVEIATAHYGPESEVTLRNMRQHAMLIIRVGRLDEGSAKLARLLATETRVLGADHRQTRATKVVHCSVQSARMLSQHARSTPQ